MLTYAHRPFKTLDEQTEVLIKNHNSVVSKGDVVYHLGDIFWHTVPVKEALDIMNALNGVHYFTWGNHDELVEENEIIQNQFVWLKDRAVLPKTSQYPRVTITHFAQLVWPGSHRGDWHLFGHTHNQLFTTQLSFDVGVDAQGYFPVSMEQVAEQMQKKIQIGHGDPVAPLMNLKKWEKR